MTKQSELTKSRLRAAWLFLLPMLVVLVLVAGYPLLQTIWLGFTDANLTDLSQKQFIGFDNYYVDVDGKAYGLLADADWWRAVVNTLELAVTSVLLETILGLIVALVLNASFRGRALVRAAVLIPWAIPTVVSAKMWGWMLNDQFGFVNHYLMEFGILSDPIAWTANSDWALRSVVMVDVWKTTPFMALLILAALQMLPSSCYEAAKVDGIHPVKVFFRVTLPLIRPALMVAIIFRFLDALRIFDLIYVLTSNSKDTMSMSIYARQQLVDFQQVGYGSAASTLLFFIIALVTVVYIVVGRVRLD
ncbi:carbohydrate ABC transporter permease [Haliangium ochraceum]|uniref:Binding-protein-dependent transport systems inner membrane component n=1 Tax=Haliangium ochraceum (strain DSM 14365 / JCM 11303 / SMP-2) TaxID=502025 RepID=D0LSE8_HALO1|nr:sugar ABC transporter permease [Haliangium ochraceum]ACY15647.1 binding-protein-dependent transport systems inner membrane component [Haliangium ochraceum DSM 14365]